jgi:hypothetical protein
MITVVSSGLASSQQFEELELRFVAKAAGSAFELIPAQLSAASKVRVMQGNGVAGLVDLAQAHALVKSESGVVSVEGEAIAQDLVSYLAAVPAAADGAKALAFVVGGLTGTGDIACAELSWSSSGSAAANFVSRLSLVGPAKRRTSVGVPVLATDSLVAFPAVGVIAGAFVCPDVLDVPAVGAIVTLKLKILV